MNQIDLLFSSGHVSNQHILPAKITQFSRVLKLLSEADCIIFVGTSLAVTLTDLAMKEARRRKVEVFNFNLEEGRIQPTQQLNVENIIGRSEATLPRLAEEVKRALREQQH